MTEQVPLQVVGAGLGRTGTTSLHLALAQLLGGRCHHMHEVFADPGQPVLWTAAFCGRPDWPAIFDGFVAAVDWPEVAFWRELAFDVAPDSLVLLSTRSDSATWWRSASATIFAVPRSGGAPPVMADWFATVAAMFERTGIDITDEASARAGYERHIAAVRHEVPADRLLEWQPGDGWEPLCARLGVPVPDEPFPHANTSEDWQARSAERRSDEPVRPERLTALVARAYRRFAAHDVDGLLPMLAPDVRWPDVARGEVLRGRQAVGAYWSAQFRSGDPRVVPRSIEADGDEVVATVAQHVRDLHGEVVVPHRTVVHRYSFDADDLVSELRVEPADG